MNFTRTAAAATLALTTALAGGSALAQDNSSTQKLERVEVGVLDCTVEGGAGFIIRSTKNVSCAYRPAGGAPAEAYVGTINKYGIDVGETQATYMTWAVLAPTADPFAPGALSGNYYGVSAEATAGVGVGANALVGGSNETISLQPLSVSGQTGLNFALAVSELDLRSTAQ